jgi:predicted DCC family thiol-disulfide oxidoreductase YuxK
VRSNEQWLRSMSSEDSTYLVYDGECPFCSRFVKLVRLRQGIGHVELIDARHPHPVVSRLAELGIDLDEGMALVQGSRISYGDECIHQIALLSTSSGMFNRLHAWIFRSRYRSMVLYPILRAGAERHATHARSA